MHLNGVASNQDKCVLQDDFADGDRIGIESTGKNAESQSPKELSPQQGVQDGENQSPTPRPSSHNWWDGGVARRVRSSRMREKGGAVLTWHHDLWDRNPEARVCSPV